MVEQHRIVQAPKSITTFTSREVKYYAFTYQSKHETRRQSTQVRRQVENFKIFWPLLVLAEK